MSSHQSNIILNSHNAIATVWKQIHLVLNITCSQNNISHLLPKSQEETAKALSAVIRACLPPGNGPILLSKLRRLWSVSATHLHNLCTAGQITVIPNPQLKATESPLLSRESVTAFLRARRFL